MGYPFGSDFTYRFAPLVDNESPDPLLTAQAPAIYVFRTMPDRTAAAAGTGAIATVTTWAWDAERRSWSFTVPAISDPNPTSTDGTEDFYLAVNFRLQAGAQLQTVVQLLQLERVAAQSGRPLEVSENDLRDLYPHIDSYSTATQRDKYAAQAVLHVRDKLDRQGFEWARLHQPSELKQAVVLKALSMLLFVASQEANDKHWLKHQYFEKEFQLTLDGLKLAVDSSGDGIPDATTSGMGTVLLLR